MKKENFYSYKKYFWFWFSLLLLGGLSTLYFYDHPFGGRRGDTTIGYSLGVVATVIILYLMWYGIRKRSYYARNTTLISFLSSHVWLGISLILLVPLHSGFSFGYNVHTVAYILMLAVIFSGIYGSVLYLINPSKIQPQKAGVTLKSLVEQISNLSIEIDYLSKNRSPEFLNLKKMVDRDFNPKVGSMLLNLNSTKHSKEDIAELMSKVKEKESDEAYRLVSLATKKINCIQQIEHEIKLKAKFRSWLYLHLPLSFALLIALAIHIFSVFYYY